MNRGYDGPAPDAAWELWYQDAFDRDSPRQVETTGVGLIAGLLALWHRHLFETVLADGARGFSRFNLWWQQARQSVEVTGDWAGQVRLRTWALENEALLQDVAALHHRLLRAGQTSAPILEAARNAESRCDFEAWVARAKQ